MLTIVTTCTQKKATIVYSMMVQNILSSHHDGKWMVWLSEMFGTPGVPRAFLCWDVTSDPFQVQVFYPLKWYSIGECWSAWEERGERERERLMSELGQQQSYPHNYIVCCYSLVLNWFLKVIKILIIILCFKCTSISLTTSRTSVQYISGHICRSAYR